MCVINEWSVNKHTSQWCFSRWMEESSSNTYSDHAELISWQCCARVVRFVSNLSLSLRIMFRTLTSWCTQTGQTGRASCSMFPRYTNTLRPDPLMKKWRMDGTRIPEALSAYFVPHKRIYVHEYNTSTELLLSATLWNPFPFYTIYIYIDMCNVEKKTDLGLTVFISVCLE